MKRPADVGSDFDGYVRRWRKENYGLETGHGAQGVVIDPERADRVQLPGDEWGDTAPLRDMYRALVARFAVPSGPLNVLEIGAGGGRSTAVMLDALGDRCGDYHVVDVSAAFIEVLQQRIDRPVVVHLVDDIDLSGLPSDHFDICLAQSSWSHINLYDQYRYLNRLRRVLKTSAIVLVSGQFLLGLGDDWTWNRFRRRVDQIDHGTVAVYHEFTSVAALGEMLTRLHYDIVCLNSNGFVARRSSVGDDGGVVPLAGPITFPFNPSQRDYLLTGRARTVSLPTVVAQSSSTEMWPRTGSRSPTSTRVRALAKRVPGLRRVVLWGRRTYRRAMHGSS